MTSARQKLKGKLAAQFVKTMQKDNSGFARLSAKQQQGVAKSFVSLVSHLSPDNSDKALKKTFNAVLKTVGNLDRLYEAALEPRYRVPVGYKLVKEDLRDHPAYGM